MIRKRGNIQRWHKAFIWALLANIVKKIATEKIMSGGMGKFTDAVKGIGNIITPEAQAEVQPPSIEPQGAQQEIPQAELAQQYSQPQSMSPEALEMMKKDALISKATQQNLPPNAYSNIGLGQLEINKPQVEAPVDKVQPPSTFNSAFLDSLVGKEPDLEGAGRMAYLGDTVADFMRTGMRLSPTSGVPISQQKQETIVKEQGLVKKDIENLYNTKGLDWNDPASVDKVFRQLLLKYPNSRLLLKSIFYPGKSGIDINLNSQSIKDELSLD